MSAVSEQHDRAKRLADIVKHHEHKEHYPAITPHADRGWLLTEITAADKALATLGVPGDGRSLAERIDGLAHDAKYGASYRESWERLRILKDESDLARATAASDRDILRRASIATAIALGESFPEDAGPDTIAAALRRGIENNREAVQDFNRKISTLRAAFEAAHAALDPVVARRDAVDDPPLALAVRAATAAKIAQELADKLTAVRPSVDLATAMRARANTIDELNDMGMPQEQARRVNAVTAALRNAAGMLAAFEAGT